jgi:hypothetical protein
LIHERDYYHDLWLGQLKRTDDAEATVAAQAAALENFAKISASDGDDFSRYDDVTIVRCEVTAGDIRKARAALASQSRG